jgi:hypothetical protein
VIQKKMKNKSQDLLHIDKYEQQADSSFYPILRQI